MTQNDSLNDTIVLLQRVHRWRMAFFCLIILIAGTVIGASCMFIYQKKHGLRLPAPKPNPITQKTSSSPKSQPDQGDPYIKLGNTLEKHLKLNEQQYQQLLPILDQHLKELNKIKMEARPKIRKELNEMNEKVLELLNENQKKKWRQDYSDLRKKFQLDYRPRTQNNPNNKAKVDQNKTTPNSSAPRPQQQDRNTNTKRQGAGNTKPKQTDTPAEPQPKEPTIP